MPKFRLKLADIRIVEVEIEADNDLDGCDLAVKEYSEGRLAWVELDHRIEIEDAEIASTPPLDDDDEIIEGLGLTWKEAQSEDYIDAEFIPNDK